MEHNLLTVLLLVACGSYPAGDVALASLESSDITTVTIQDKWISFEAVEAPSDIGVVFYPGGKVESEAYAPIIRMIADSGISTYLLYLPRDLAILNSDAAEKVMDEVTMDGWVVAGHSLGGVAAAKMASFDDRIVGVSLWASYPAGTVDISNSSLVAQSIAGSEDTVLNWKNHEASAEQLPASTQWVTIEGGNHAQFGDYGAQDGDGEASISPKAQWRYTTDAVLSLYDRLD